MEVQELVVWGIHYPLYVCWYVSGLLIPFFCYRLYVLLIYLSL